MMRGMLPLLVPGVMGGLMLDSIALAGGKENTDGLRGQIPGDMLGVDGANQFWCGVLFNVFSSKNGLAKKKDAVADNVAETLAENNVTVQAADVEGDGRFTLKAGESFTVTGVINDALMKRSGGNLSFALLPGKNPNFMARQGPFSPDGGFPLGIPTPVEAWPAGGDPEMTWTQNLFWPTEANYVGDYVIQVIFRSDQPPTDTPDQSFAQCIDITVKEGTPLPEGCQGVLTDDCMEKSIFPSESGAPPVAQEAKSGTQPPKPKFSAGAIAGIVIAVLVLLLIIILIIYLLCCRKKSEPKEEVKQEAAEPIVHPDPEPAPVLPPIPKEEKEESRSSNKGVVQIQYTDNDPPAQEPPEKKDSSGEHSGEGPDSPDGSQGRVFHFRYVNANGGEGEEGGSDAHTGPAL